MSAVVEAIPCTATRGSALEVLRAFAKLGLTSFGGPVSHLGYFRTGSISRHQGHRF
jgi:chromate transporter